jgi:hypothetical protein
VNIRDACVIIRDGYGMRSTVEGKIDHSILNTVKHTFSYDITGIELCYLASGRDIVHLIAEGRSHVENGKCKGSDGFNLIPYPLIKAVGGVVCALNGIELGETKFDPHKIYDFIGAVNLELVDEFIEKAVKI